MSCQAVVRNNTVVFTATFYDESGTPIVPTGATLRVSYQHNGVDTLFTTAMTNSSGTTWTAQWDTDEADTGTAYWHVQSDGTPSAADDGSVTITANAANPES